MSYTERFTEVHKLLYHEPADSQAAAFNSGWLYVGNYHRIAVVLSVGDMAQGATLNMLVQGSTTAAGLAPATIAGKIMTQLTQAGGDGDDAVCIEVRTEEMAPNNYDYLRVVVTPAVGAVECALLVFGIVSRFEPVGVTEWAEVID